MWMNAFEDICFSEREPGNAILYFSPVYNFFLSSF